MADSQKPSGGSSGEKNRKAAPKELRERYFYQTAPAHGSVAQPSGRPESEAIDEGDARKPVPEKPSEAGPNGEADAGESEAPLLPGERAVRPGGSQGLGLPTSLVERPADRDLLGRDGLVKGLTALFRSEEQGTPLTMGLFGSWGTGKSTILRMVESRLRAEAPGRFAFATFNAWEYEHTGNLAAGLAQEVVSGLVKDLRWWERLRLRLCFAGKEYKWKILKTLGSLLLAALSGCVPWFFNDSAGELALPGSILGFGGAAVFLWLAAGSFLDLKALWNHPLSTELFTYLKLPQYGEYLGLLPVLKRHIRTLCALELRKTDKGQRRLVVFIDDLDRCDLEGIVGVFEAVRLVMDLPHVFVVIAMDAEVALEAIASRYGGKGNLGAADTAREYLGKIVQIPIRLSTPVSLDAFLRGGLFPDAGVPAPPSPPIVPSESESFARAMRDEDTEAAHFQRLAEVYSFSNPRLLLRLRNSYRLLKLLNLLRSEPEAYYGHGLLLNLLFFVEFMAQGASRSKDEMAYVTNLVGRQHASEVHHLDAEILSQASKEIESDDREHLKINAADAIAFVRAVVLPNTMNAA